MNSQAEEAKDSPGNLALAQVKISQNQALTIHTPNRFLASAHFFGPHPFLEFRGNYSCGTNPALLFGQLADLANN
jgi:hypothetical protein